MLGVVIILFGLCAIFVFFYFNKLANTSESWLPIPATIIEQRMLVSKSDASMSRNQSYMIKFKYSINDKEYFSNKIQFFGQSLSSSEQLQKRFQDKTEVTAFYNPNSPEQAVLIKGGARKNYPIIVLGLFFICVGVGLIIFDK